MDLKVTETTLLFQKNSVLVIHYSIIVMKLFLVTHLSKNLNENNSKLKQKTKQNGTSVSILRDRTWGLKIVKPMMFLCTNLAVD